MRITNPYGPNTTVLLPGTCNAKCVFCFWDRKEGLIKPPVVGLLVVDIMAVEITVLAVVPLGVKWI